MINFKQKEVTKIVATIGKYPNPIKENTKRNSPYSQIRNSKELTRNVKNWPPNDCSVASKTNQRLAAKFNKSTLASEAGKPISGRRRRTSTK